MKRYTYEFEIFEDSGFWCVLPFGLGGATQGNTREEAIESAAEWLQIVAEDAEIWKKELSSPVFGMPLEHGGERLIVSVVAGRETIDTVSAAQAAELLGVSRPRVSQLLNSKALEGWIEGRNTFVTVDSIMARLSEPLPVGGRPKKIAAVAL